MDTVRKLFKKIETSRERESLESEILQAIMLACEARQKRRLAVAYAGLLLSGVTILYVSLTYGGVILASDFWNIILLFFSDVTVLANYWNDFFLLLLETIPVVPILFVLIPTFFFLLFLSMFFQTSRRQRYSY